MSRFLLELLACALLFVGAYALLILGHGLGLT